jgi:hypothetical protein
MTIDYNDNCVTFSQCNCDAIEIWLNDTYNWILPVDPEENSTSIAGWLVQPGGYISYRIINYDEWQSYTIPSN